MIVFFNRFIRKKLRNFINGNSSPSLIYIFFFIFQTKYKYNSSLKLFNLQNDLYKFIDTIKGREFQWSFPSTLKERGRRCYLKGLNYRSKEISEDYGIKEIKFNKGDKIIDCGANFGDLYLFLSTLDIELNYFAFEPGREEFKSLSYNISNNKNKIKTNIFQEALGETLSLKNFFYSPEGADSSLIKIKDYSKMYQVKVNTIDSFINSNYIKGQKIKLLKLEAEGFEPEILQGCLENIGSIEYITADIGPERGISEKTTLVEVSNLLFANGFIMTTFNYPRRFTIIFRNKSFLSN